MKLTSTLFTNLTLESRHERFMDCYSVLYNWKRPMWHGSTVVTNTDTQWSRDSGRGDVEGFPILWVIERVSLGSRGVVSRTIEKTLYRTVTLSFLLSLTTSFPSFPLFFFCFLLIFVFSCHKIHFLLGKISPSLGFSELSITLKVNTPSIPLPWPIPLQEGPKRNLRQTHHLPVSSV